MAQQEGHHLHGSDNDINAFIAITRARMNFETALEYIECPLCKADVKLIYEATVEVERISGWAAHNNVNSVKTIRALARELDKLHMLGMLTTLYKYFWRR